VTSSVLIDDEARSVPRISWARALCDWPRLRRDPLSVLSAWRDRRGACFRLPGRRPVFAITDPADVRHVLVTRQPFYPKGGNFELTRETLGDGLVTSNGPLHDRQRRLLAPVFLRGKWDALPAAVEAEAERAATEWTRRENVDLARESARVAIQVVGRVFFGLDLAPRVEEIQEAFLAGQHYMAAGAFSFWPGWVRRRWRPAFQRATAAVVRVGEDILAAAERGEARTDFLETLMRARDSHGAPLPRKLLRDEIITLLGAGHETTGAAIGWTFDRLFQHPGPWAAFQREAREGSNAGSFVRACLLESMRLRPPVWCLGRRAMESDRLPSGVDVPAGAHVVIFTHLLNTDPRHFTNPAVFRPERFVDAENGGAPPFSFLPFGGGPRSCLGENFAMVEMISMMRFWVRRFDLAPISAAPARPQPLVSLRPRGGVWARVRPRPST